MLPIVIAVTALLAGCGSDEPKSTGDGGGATPTGVASSHPSPKANVPGACTLITKYDLTTVTKDTVTLIFAADPTEENSNDPVYGAVSRCTFVLKSQWSESGGTSIIDGVVTVTIQADGAFVYFPARSSDTPVSGLGDEAIGRGRTLYVRLGAGMLTVDVSVQSPAEDREAAQLAWAKALAPIAMGRAG